MSSDILVRTEPRLRAAVKRLAYAQGKSVNRLICELLHRECEEQADAADILHGRVGLIAGEGGFPAECP